MFKKTDRSSDIDLGFKELKIRSTDWCRHYEKHPYTMLWKEECWTCRYGDFGVDAGNPTDTGTCGYKK